TSAAAQNRPTPGVMSLCPTGAVLPGCDDEHDQNEQATEDTADAERGEEACGPPLAPRRRRLPGHDRCVPAAQCLVVAGADGAQHYVGGWCEGSWATAPRPGGDDLSRGSCWFTC